ncbi:unnamed protein product [Mytilus edulis]|uniref:Uncharacterized protein n=1 Tax=Mytilus edulis TaxID=6550 RepID=A0A8S3RMP8_MYTED|nr:unnamed protein product [Mytilus edulis]
MIDLLEPCFLTPNDYNLRRDSQNYTIPRCRTVSYYRSFIPSVVKLWNELDTNAKNALSINQFKSVLDKIYKPEIPPKYFCSGKRNFGCTKQGGYCSDSNTCPSSGGEVEKLSVRCKCGKACCKCTDTCPDGSTCMSEGETCDGTKDTNGCCGNRFCCTPTPVTTPPPCVPDCFFQCKDSCDMVDQEREAECCGLKCCT